MSRLKEVLALARERYGNPRSHYDGALEEVRCYCVGGAVVMAATDPNAAPEEFQPDQRWPDVEHLALTLVSLCDVPLMRLRREAEAIITDNDDGRFRDAWGRLERLAGAV